MDSSYFLISSNQTNTNATSNIINNNDLEQSSSSSSFNYDPFEGFSFLDQQGMRLYDYFGTPGGGRNSPPLLINQCSSSFVDQLDLQTKNFPFQADPQQLEDEDDDFQGTLNSFINDVGFCAVGDHEANHTSGVDLFATNALDCSESAAATATDHMNNINEVYSPHHHHNHNNHHHHHHHSQYHNNNHHHLPTSDSNNISSSGNINNNLNINNNHNYTNSNNINNNNNYAFNSYNCNGDSNASQTKRSVLMNLLIDGSDLGAGYKIRNNSGSNQTTTS